jgi:ABC-type phosphate/phosphonate transport system substrate-binding protein
MRLFSLVLVLTALSATGAFASSEVVCEAATIVTNPGGDGSTQSDGDNDGTKINARIKALEAQGKKVTIKSLSSSAAALSPAAALSDSRQIVTKGFLYSANCAALEY